ncbi:MAG: DNA replication/repair protein RecF [Eubacteriaceae bacterium]|nr:DNA replication/repair protein RecF [Eubacteriaceae bacterium]
MYLKKLKLMNFRNYDTLDIELDQHINIFVGDNAQGKTNILESIYFLSRGKSFRNNNSDLIGWSHENSFAEGVFIKKNYDENIKISISKDDTIENTAVFINAKKIKARSDLYGKIMMVNFTPEDLSIIKDGPENRRKFIDNELLNIKPVHGRLLKDYARTLKQRNELLKNIWKDPSLKSTIEIWNEQLISYGKKIIVNRIIFLQKLNKISRKIHKILTDDQEELKLYYISNLIKNHEDMDNIEKIFKESLESSFDNDIKKGYTSIGPHLDDIKININDFDSKVFGSQGQQRTCALSLKLSQLELISEETGEVAIVLLDDVMSELDSSRQKRLIEFFRNSQVIITCTDTNFLNSIQTESKKIYTIYQGKIINNENN